VRTGFKLLGLYPPAKAYMVQMKYKPRPRFGAGLQVADARGAKATVVGSMIPQPLVMTVARDEVLLDEILPDTPVALVFHETPQEVLTAQAQADLERAGATVIGLTPEWSTPQSGAFPIVRDRSRFFSDAPFAGYLGQILLLRRDRYVAAVAAPDQTSTLLSALKTMRVPPAQQTGSTDGTPEVLIQSA
jgi:3-(3-hydroxy-phenyl)propionate hydroxylase